MQNNKSRILFVFILSLICLIQCTNKGEYKIRERRIVNELSYVGSDSICFVFINPSDSTYILKGKMGIFYNGLEEGIDEVWLDKTRTFILDSSSKIVISKSYLKKKFKVSNNDSLFAGFGYVDEDNSYTVGFYFRVSQSFVKKEVRVFPLL